MTLSAISRLLLGIDGNVEELAVTVALALESSSLTVGVLQTIPFIKRRPRLHNLELTAPQSELQRFELASGYSNDKWSL